MRLSLLEHLYEAAYMQRFREPDPTKWRCQILTQRSVVSASNTKTGSLMLNLATHPTVDGDVTEELEVDYVFVATGYRRDAHEEMLCEARELLASEEGRKGGRFAVGRDYRVQFDGERVEAGQCGVWLQGCNEVTHGVSSSPFSCCVGLCCDE